jgi:MFS transporter, DHA1 family, tetracycline resistance protein
MDADDTVIAVTGQRRLTILWLTAFVDQLGFGMVLPFMPLYADRLGASGLDVGLLLAVYSLMQMLVSTAWGRLSDRIGRRPVIIASALGVCAGFVIMGFAVSLPMLFVGRALLGSFGVGMSAAQAWVADVTAPEDRGRALAQLGAAGAAGFVLGPALGALGILAGGMRLPFFLAAGVALGNAVLAATLLPRVAPQPRSSAPSGRIGWRAIVPCLAVAFALTYAFSNIEATFALFTRAQLGFDAADNGWLFMTIGVTAVATQALGMRWLVAVLDEPRRLALGLVLLGGGAALLPASTSLALLLPALVVMAAGFSIAAPSLTAWVSRRAPVDRQGEMIGLTQAVGSLARIAGPGVGGFVFDHVGHAAPFQIAAMMIAGTAVLALSARR